MEWTFSAKVVVFLQGVFLTTVGILFTEVLLEAFGLSLLFWLGWMARQLTMPDDVEIVEDEDYEA